MPRNNLLSSSKDSRTGGRKSAETRLERQGFDLTSVRIQMLIGCILIAASCVILYLPCLKIGFLLDDFLHVDIAARAFHGDSRDLFANLTSNWAGSDLMKSYRPVVSMSFALDYLIYHAHAFGYHLTNIILLIACCILVSLITLEVTGRSGNKLMAAPAIWAGLLFAVYPLHPEATAWVVGRVDLLCTAFYLASLFAFLRYQQLQETRYLFWSLAAFVVSMLSKEMAVSLPFVVTAAGALLAPDELERGKTNVTTWEQTLNIIRLTWLFWVVLVGIALVRTVFLGTLIGGYGNAEDEGLISILSSLQSFLDRPTINKIIVPVSEEMHVQQQILALCALLAPVVVALGVIKATVFKSPFRPIVFLLFWIAIGIAPTFQIWHIYPNLVGSRLFFLSSVPLCILISLLAQPATEAINRRPAASLAIAGTATLSVLFLTWCFCLEKNLHPWVEAGKRMKAAANQLDEITALKKGETVSLLSLPRDYKGAGMLTRPSYLNMFLKPPFHKTDISKKFASLELPFGSDHEFGDRARALAISHPGYSYNDDEGIFVPWKRPEGLAYFNLDFTSTNAHNYTVAPPSVVPHSADKWQVREPGQAYVEEHPDFIRVYAGTQQEALTITPKILGNVDPIEVQFATVHCYIHDRDDQDAGDGPNRAARISVVWNGKDAQHNQISTFEKPLEYLADDLFIAPVGELPEWDLGHDLNTFGLKFTPGNYIADVYSVSLGSKPKSRILKTNGKN